MANANDGNGGLPEITLFLPLAFDPPSKREMDACFAEFYHKKPTKGNEQPPGTIARCDGFVKMTKNLLPPQPTLKTPLIKWAEEEQYGRDKIMRKVKLAEKKARQHSNHDFLYVEREGEEHLYMPSLDDPIFHGCNSSFYYPTGSQATFRRTPNVHMLGPHEERDLQDFFGFQMYRMIYIFLQMWEVGKPFWYAIVGVPGLYFSLEAFQYATEGRADAEGCQSGDKDLQAVQNVLREWFFEHVEYLKFSPRAKDPPQVAQEPMSPSKKRRSQEWHTG